MKGPIAAIVAPCSTLCSKRAMASIAGPCAGWIGSGQIGVFVGKTWLPTVIVALRNVCAGANRNIASPSYLERVAYMTSSPASIIGDRSNPDQLNCGPIEYHGQRAQIVDVPSQVGIEV